MAGGRPRIIESPEEMDDLVEEFIEECQDEDKPKPITLSGLILHLGLSSRESLDEYGRREEFSDSVKRAKMIIANVYEQNLHANAPAGSIFALKNMGWSDKKEVELAGKEGSPIEITGIDVVFVDPEPEEEE